MTKIWVNSNRVIFLNDNISIQFFKIMTWGLNIKNRKISKLI